MSLTVEDGSGIPAATSYVSLAKADSHFAALDQEDWVIASEGLREQALIRASSYVDFFDYPGGCLKAAQGLKWPRSGAVDGEGRSLVGLPHALITAVLEVVPGFLASPERTAENGVVLKRKVGDLELVYSDHRRVPSFAFRLLRQIGASANTPTLIRG